MRKLASIQKVLKITPIEGADVIVNTKVNDWNCITKKGEFKDGDLGVYFEIDSFLPAEDKRYSFLEKNFINWEGNNGARIRTIKLKGQLAQGLMLPLYLFTEIEVAEEGMDVTELLNVKKWEAPIPAQLSGMVKGAFPSFIQKTDEERIQNLTSELEDKILGKKFRKTIKLDGTSMTVFKYDERNGVCGRNWELTETAENSLWHVARRDKLLEGLESLGKNIALQGELIGEAIQGNNEAIKGHEFRLFKIWDIDNKRFATAMEKEEYVKQLVVFGSVVKMVPDEGEVEFDVENFNLENVVQKILDMADGPSLFAKNREGVVFQRLDGKFSFKAISNWYLLKHANR